MIGHEDNQEEVHYKVADKRKFNADGSLREGVTLEPEKKPEPVAPAPKEEAPQPQSQSPVDADEMPADAPFDTDEMELGVEEDDDVEDIPGAKDPASFVNFLSSLATNAAAALGAVPHPATGKRSLDLESGRYWLDILTMLRDKTNGNLHPKEARLLEGLLGDLKMQYVHIMRATEEKLKSQAAAKFSGEDILGKKK